MANSPNSYVNLFARKHSTAFKKYIKVVYSSTKGKKNPKYGFVDHTGKVHTVVLEGTNKNATLKNKIQSYIESQLGDAPLEKSIDKSFTPDYQYVSAEPVNLRPPPVVDNTATGSKRQQKDDKYSNKKQKTAHVRKEKATKKVEKEKEYKTRSQIPLNATGDIPMMPTVPNPVTNFDFPAFPTPPGSPVVSAENAFTSTTTTTPNIEHTPHVSVNQGLDTIVEAPRETVVPHAPVQVLENDVVQSVADQLIHANQQKVDALGSSMSQYIQALAQGIETSRLSQAEANTFFRDKLLELQNAQAQGQNVNEVLNGQLASLQSMHTQAINDLAIHGAAAVNQVTQSVKQTASAVEENTESVKEAGNVVKQNTESVQQMTREFSKVRYALEEQANSFQQISAKQQLLRMDKDPAPNSEPAEYLKVLQDIRHLLSKPSGSYEIEDVEVPTIFAMSPRYRVNKNLPPKNLQPKPYVVYPSSSAPKAQKVFDTAGNKGIHE